MERDDMIAKVQDAIDQIRPYLQMDGGDIEYVDLTEDNVVEVRLQGHCAGCPGAVYTLKMLVERKIREMLPEIAGVKSVM